MWEGDHSKPREAKLIEVAHVLKTDPAPLLLARKAILDAKLAKMRAAGESVTKRRGRKPKEDRELRRFAKFLREEMEAAGQFQLELARALGVHQATVSGWEGSRNLPSALELEAIIETLTLNYKSSQRLKAAWTYDFKGGLRVRYARKKKTTPANVPS